MSDDELSMLPPALRMAAQSRGPPGKSKSFQRRREQTDALAKVRCQPRMDLADEEQKRRSVLQKRLEEKAKRESEAQVRQANEQSKTVMETMTRESQMASLGMSWSRMNLSPTTSLTARKSSLNAKALEMRERIAQLRLEVEEEEKAASTTIKEGHTEEILQKKLDKVTKLLGKETPGTKDHKKLTRKKEQYENELEELLMQGMQQSKSAADALKEAQEEVADIEEQLEETEDELREAAEQRKREEEEEEAAAEEERRQREEEEEKERKRAEAAAAEDEEMDEKERIRQERIEEYHRKQAARKAEEQEEKKGAERKKEYQTLKKKLAKVESMIEDAENDGNDSTKLGKKKAEYLSKLDEFDEWKEELESRRQREEAKRLRREREEEEKRQKEETERARKEAEEAERLRKAEEEEERIRLEAEEAQRELEEAQREREAEEERLREERLEAERRREEEEEDRKRQEEEEEERRLKEEEDAEEARQMMADKEAEEAAERAEEEEERRLKEEEDAAEAREMKAEKEAEEAEEAAERAAEEEAQRAEEEEERQRAAQEQAEAGQEVETAETTEKAEQDEPPPPVPKAKPRMGGGLLAAIQAKGTKKTEAEGQPKRSGGLLAAIAARGGKPSSSSATSKEAEKPAEPETPEEKEAREEKERADAEKRKNEAEEREKRRDELKEQTKQAEAAAAEEKVRKPPKPSISQDFLDLRAIPEPHSDNTKKLLAVLEDVEGKQAKYEKTLKQNGIAISEDIPYEVAKEKVTEIQQQMQELATSTEDPYIVQKKYSTLEEDFTKYFTAMTLTDEYAEELRLAEEKWETSVLEENIAALKKVRSHMPVNIRNMTEEELTTKPSPNGKLLPKAMARKFKRSNVLQLIRVNPHDLERMHPSLIDSLRSTGLTLIERRALHEHLKDIGARWQDLQQDPSIARKYSWFMGLKSKFKEMVAAQERGGSSWGGNGVKRSTKADTTMSYEDDYGYSQEAEYEKSEAAKSSLGDSSHHGTNSGSTPKKKHRPTNNSKEKDEQLMLSIRERMQLDEPESNVDTKLLRELFHAEKRLLSLEKQLTQNGIALPKEDITYAVAKAKVAEITEDIKEIASKMGAITDMKEMAKLEKAYSQLSDELEKYNNALMLTKEWALELIEKEKQWEESVRPDNEEALRSIRRHMPVNIKDLSENDMIQGITPNGKQLPQKIVRKFKRTNILQLVRMPPSSIEPMHPSSLESMRSTGLTLTERRALHEHLKDLGAKWKASSNDKMSERKWMWHASLRGKFKELVAKHQQNPPRASHDIDYSEDYGFPPEAVYNVEAVKKSNLLTVEELERRKSDDEWGYDAPVQQEEAPRQMPAGMMASIASSGKPAPKPAPTPAPSNSKGPARPQMGGGLLAAIASKGANKGGNTEESSAPPTGRPRMGGGLLAAIQTVEKEKQEKLAASEADPAAVDTTAADSTAAESEPVPEPPEAKKRSGGLLGGLLGRRKK